MEITETNVKLLFIGVPLAVMALFFYLNRKRVKDLQQLASSLGLSFSHDGPEPGALAATGIEIFRTGYSSKASSLITFPARSGNISVFDYRYTTHGGKNRSTHKFTLALIAVPGREIPVFDLKPESFIYKIGEALGFKDIDLPAFPEFSDKYRLTGPDAAAVHMFFTPQRAAWFERNQGLRVQGAAGHLVLFKREGLLPVAEWQSFIEEAKAFATEILI
ncbi:MAG TPA: hypothetical protein PKI19_01335 [Elusimicrobiales bacterium]|nr:hypothetical protein [Elusimicrobiales bacterium]